MICINHKEFFFANHCIIFIVHSIPTFLQSRLHHVLEIDCFNVPVSSFTEIVSRFISCTAKAIIRQLIKFAIAHRSGTPVVY